MDLQRASPNKEHRGRFHYNSDEPDEPWHITVDFGNRQTWGHGEGFFRRGYHIYAKGDNLANGYAGYCSPVNRTGNLMNIAASPSLGQSGVMRGAPSSLNEKESVLGVPRGVRGYFRNSAFRRTLYETTLREFKPPKALFELGDMNELNDMINCICEGASKSARPSKGKNMVIDFSGNWVKAHQAISDARKAGKEVPLGWKKIAQHELLRSCDKGRAAGSAYEKTMRTRRAERRTTRPWQGSPKSRTSEATKEASRPLFKTRDSWDEGLLDFPKEHSECKRSELNVSNRSEEVQRARMKGRSRRTAGPSQSKKSEAAKRAPSLKLTIRDPPNIGTSASQNGSASGTLDSKDSCEQLLTNFPEGKRPESKGRPRKATRSRKEFDLGRALLDVTHEPTGFVDYKKAAGNRKLASDDRATGPRLDRLSGSSVGALLLDYTGPASGGRSPRASSSRKGKARPCGLVESASDTRGFGKPMSRPLPPSDTDAITKNGKKVRNPSKLQGVEKRRALKMTPKWVLPRSTKGGTSDEIHV